MLGNQVPYAIDRMTYTTVKVLISAILIVAISEIGKKNSLMAGILASLPVVSLLAFVWLYVDTRDTEKVASLASSIFWLVLPSLVLFLVLPALLRAGYGFYTSLGVASIATAVCYYGMVLLLGFFKISL